jgi:hypothetical protein
MRRALLLIALTACAPANNPGEEATPRQAAIYQDPTTGTLLADRPRSVAIDLAAPPASVWIAVKKVYADLDIPLSVESPAAHQIGNENFYKSRQLAGQPMTQFVDCGSDMTGPKAASYRINMSLLTTVAGDGKGGTNVQTTFVPMGQDLSGTSSDKIPCGTTGRFEALVLDRVKTAVGR